MSYDNEKQVAEIAAQILTVAMRSKIGSLGFKHHISSGAKKSISEALGDYKGKDFTTEDGRAIYYLNKITLQMERHGFIHHYGDQGTRKGGERNRKKPRSTTYTFRTHEWNLPSRDYIDDAIKQSGVIPFVMENVTKLRGEEIMVYLKNFLEK